MSKLTIPSEQTLERQFTKDKLVSKEQMRASMAATLKAYATPFAEEDHPICAALGEEKFNALCNFNTELMEKGAPLQDRLDQVSARVDEVMRASITLGTREAALLERDLALMVHEKKLDPNDTATSLGKLAKKGAWFTWIKKWFDYSHRHYSSIRYASASGTTGSGWRRKWRTLRVVATTAGSNFMVKLFGIPILSQTTIACYVVASHFRAPGGVIPASANPLIAGATRNGNTQTNSGNSWIVSKATVFTDNDPNLQNLTYFGSSSDAGISLYASGTP